MIQAANDRTKGRGGGRISKEEAKAIIAQAQESKSFEKTGKKTLAYIYATYSLTKGAKELIVQALV